MNTGSSELDKAFARLDWIIKNIQDYQPTPEELARAQQVLDSLDKGEGAPLVQWVEELAGISAEEAT